MKPPGWRDLVVAGVLVAGMLALGGSILGFSARSMLLARESRSWPTVQGVVVAAGLDEGRARVATAYEVDGVSHRTERVGFDVFDQPGGRGTSEAILARYPVGAQVGVHVRPGDPTRAVLEPGDTYPFVMPMVLGGLLFAGGLLTAAQVVARARGRPWRPSVADRVRLGAALVTGAITLALVVAVADPAAQDVFDEAFGPWLPAGVSGGEVATVGIALAALPLPFAAWHTMNAMVLSGRPTPYVIPFLAWYGGPGRASAIRALLGFTWFVGLIIGWIAFAAWRGV
jgi:hypothetical protein